MEALMSNTESHPISGPEQSGEDSPARIHGLAKWILICVGSIGIFLHINQLFNFQFFVGKLMLDTSYYYLLVGLFLAAVFMVYPAIKTAKHHIPWYDWALAAGTLGSSIYLSYYGERIILEGWDLVAPPLPTAVAAIICLLSLEALRRTGGGILFSICAFFFIYPLFAESMPGFLWGPQSTLQELVRMHALGTESLIGVPMRVVAGLLIGFLVFGSALVATGGGDFFLSFASALMGRSRGGPAKVAIISSAFFGSLSGSVISNVVTTGQITIPTMKRSGYPANYAAAVEACSSTGGALMPPVMGAVAFIMAEYLDVPYSTVLFAAIVPAILFYLALLFQVDMYAVRVNLQGQRKEDIPNIWVTLKSGWHFLFSLALLIYLLVWVRIETHAPYYATVVLLFTSSLRRKSPFRLKQLTILLDDAVASIANIVGVLAGIGLIVGALSYTGVGGAFSRELLQFAGDNVILLLLLGAITSFVLGMGMTVSACYIFLAVVLGPALIDAGLDPVASHLFILYWGMLSYITPPVALAAVAAAGVAGGNSLKTGFLSMRMGLINFILPFLFVMTPTLILRGEPLPILHDVITAVIAVWLMASVFEGWLYYVGSINYVCRAFLLFASLAFLLPGLITDSIGLGIVLAIYSLRLIMRKPLPVSS